MNRPSSIDTPGHHNTTLLSSLGADDGEGKLAIDEDFGSKIAVARRIRIVGSPSSRRGSGGKQREVPATALVAFLLTVLPCSQTWKSLKGPES